MTDTSTPKPPTPQPVQSPSLADLVKQIKDAHAAVVSASKSAIDRALEAGGLLNQAKIERGQHGSWLTFLKTTGLEERTAQRYMDLANNEKKLIDWMDAKSVTMSDLTLNKAMAVIKGKPDTKTDPLSAYSKAQDTLIKKLEKLSPDDADRAVDETIKELRKIVAIKTGGATKKAA